MVGHRAQHHEAVEIAPAFQSRVVHRLAAHGSLPRPPPATRLEETYGKILPLLTLGKFRNNARRDNLEGGFWRGVFGYSHGILLADAFFENVSRHRAEGRELQPGEAVQNLILEFRPQPRQTMRVACLWSRWSAPGQPDLLSFAAITDEPPPEVAAAGHDRCIIPIKPEHVDAWLKPDPKNVAAAYAILDDRERPYYEHRLAA